MTDWQQVWLQVYIWPWAITLSSQQAPDYRLYKSEPELTTVKEEVDEANGEDKDKSETTAESKDTAATKGTGAVALSEGWVVHWYSSKSTLKDS